MSNASTAIQSALPEPTLKDGHVRASGLSVAGLSANDIAHLGLLEIDVRCVLNHLRRDLRDDWFPDVLAFGDALTVEFIQSRLADLQGDPLKGYLATERIVRDIPKDSGALRYSLETTLIDRFVYQALVEELAIPLDRLLSPHVFSHRCQLDKYRSFFKPGVPQWSLFKDTVRLVGNQLWIVEADLENFYESINLATLRNSLMKGISDSEGDFREKAQRRYAAEMILWLLPTWCFDSTHGLPQNRDASSFLANQYMRGVDSDMEKHYPNYFRYMDDIRICVNSRDKARQALVTLTRSLREIGLSLNSKKTKIYQPGTEAHSMLLAQDDKRMVDINNMWSSRSQPVIARSLSYIAELAMEIVAENATNTRKFRFCVHRLQRLARTNVGFNIPHREELKSMILERLAEDAIAANELCAFLRAVGLITQECKTLEDLLLDTTLYLYEWQRYHIALVLLDQEYSSPALLAACEKEVFCDHEGSSGHREREFAEALIPRDLALVILGKYGDKNLRQRIAASYSKICRTHIEKRAGIVAVQEVSYREGISEHVQEYVPQAMRGMYRTLRQDRQSAYFLKWPPLSPAELIDTISEYV